MLAKLDSTAAQASLDSAKAQLASAKANLTQLRQGATSLKKRRKLPIATLVLALLAAVGVGFYSGVRVEKGQLQSSNATRSTSNGFGLGTAANARTRSTPSPAASGAAGNGFTGGNANIIATVTVVESNTLYVTEANGDTVKVTTTDGTTITKTVTGTVKELTPGESVAIRGVQSAEGVYAAQSVTQGSAVGQ